MAPSSADVAVDIADTPGYSAEAVADAEVEARAAAVAAAAAEERAAAEKAAAKALAELPELIKACHADGAGATAVEAATEALQLAQSAGTVPAEMITEVEAIRAARAVEVAKIKAEMAAREEEKRLHFESLFGELTTHGAAVGSHVRLQSLKARPEINGLTAVIESFVEESGRVTVKVEPTALRQDGEVLALKPANLEPLTAEEAARLVAATAEKLAERSVRVECNGTMLKLTLTPKQLQKPFKDAVLAPYLKAYSKKRGEDPPLGPDDVFQVTIDSEGQKKLKTLDNIYIDSAEYCLRDCNGEIDIDVYLKRDQPPPKPREKWLTGDNDKKAEVEDVPKGERLPDGARVEIFGLTSEAGRALNGLHGHVECWHANKGRYDVKVEGEERIVSAKHSNVRLTTHTRSGRRVG